MNWNKKNIFFPVIVIRKMHFKKMKLWSKFGWVELGDFFSTF
jgi:hypothetical protein